MSWIQDLMNELPLGSHYRSELEAMEKENAALKQEIGRLKTEIEGLKASGVGSGRLARQAEQMLLFIAREDYATAAELSQALSLSTQDVEMHVDDLVRSGYLESSYAQGPSAEYYLKHKAKRYLHNVGLRQGM
jgi:predicted HTH transcriptional regulator